MQINLATNLTRDEIVCLLNNHYLSLSDFCLLSNHQFTYVFFKDQQNETILKSVGSALWEAFDWSKVKPRDFIITGNPTLLPFYRPKFNLGTV